MKSSPVRKKSTSSSSTADEDDISNIPSLQMRIQIISQRVSLKQVNFINNGESFTITTMQITVILFKKKHLFFLEFVKAC
jgi:hypothetical protein